MSDACENYTRNKWNKWTKRNRLENYFSSLNKRDAAQGFSKDVSSNTLIKIKRRYIKKMIIFRESNIIAVLVKRFGIPHSIMGTRALTMNYRTRTITWIRTLLIYVVHRTFPPLLFINIKLKHYKLYPQMTLRISPLQSLSIRTNVNFRDFWYVKVLT